MKKTINLKLILLYIYAFIVIYIPDLSYYIKVNGVVLFIIFTSVFLIKYMGLKEKDFFKIFSKKPIFIFICLNIVFALYFAIRTAIAGISLLDFYNLRIFQNLIPIFCLVGVCIVYYELDKMKFLKKDKYKFIINVALIQGIIAISMIFIPAFRNVAYNIFYKQSTDINIYISASRLYGICDGNYTYSFQILHSILALFTFYFAYFYKEKKYYLYAVIIFLVTVLNGRTGIIIFLIGLVLLLVYIIIKEQKILKAVQIVIATLTLGIIAYMIIIKFLPNTTTLIMHAINDVISFANENDDTTEVYALVNGIFLPPGIVNKIFGTGYRVYAKYGYNFGFNQSSDIGFVNDFFMGGIFYIILVYYSYLQLIFIIRRDKTENDFEKIMAVTVLISVIISNIKGEVFRSQMQIATILFLLIFMLFKEKKNE